MNKIELLQISLEKIDLDLVRLRRPTAGAVQRMVTSIKSQGQLTPVVLAQTEHQPILIDGFKRYQAAEQLRMPELKAVMVDRVKPQVKALIYLLNKTGGFSLLEEALLIRELVEVDGLSQSDTAILMERHKTWVSRRLMLIRQLSPEIVDDAQLKLIPPGSLSSLARLPVCNQIDFSAVIQREALESQEIYQLIDLFVKTSDPGIRRFILKNPRQLLDQVQRQRKSSRRDIPTIVTRLWSLINALEKEILSDLQPNLKQEIWMEINTGLDIIKSNFSRIQPYLIGVKHEKTE